MQVIDFVIKRQGCASLIDGVVANHRAIDVKILTANVTVDVGLTTVGPVDMNRVAASNLTARIAKSSADRDISAIIIN